MQSSEAVHTGVGELELAMTAVVFQMQFGSCAVNKPLGEVYSVISVMSDSMM